jgi:glutaredoxin
VKTIYTSNNCAYCHKFKAYLKENNIEFTEKNISDNQTYRDELINLGYRSVPLFVDDESNQTIVGFDRQEVEKVLK